MGGIYPYPPPRERVHDGAAVGQMSQGRICSYAGTHFEILHSNLYPYWKIHPYVRVAHKKAETYNFASFNLISPNNLCCSAGYCNCMGPLTNRTSLKRIRKILTRYPKIRPLCKKMRKGTRQPPDMFCAQSMNTSHTSQTVQTSCQEQCKTNKNSTLAS